MNYVYVKDSEGYVSKKMESEVSADEKIISEKEYNKKSGLAFYQKKFGHGAQGKTQAESKNSLCH